MNKALVQYTAIKRGATLLDSEKPGWVALIDLDELKMESMYYCVLGQVYGHYVTAFEYLPFDFDPENFGFLCRGDPDGYASLAARWKRYITHRRVANVS